MALFKSTVLASASGSLAGSVFSRNRGGAYLRGRSIPVNPATAAQQLVRNAMASLATAWVSTLTAAERALWDQYALNVPLPNRVGDLINVGGMGMYQRGNVPRLLAGLSAANPGPTVFSLPLLSGVTMDGATVGGQTVTFSYDNTNPWANEVGGALLIYLGRAQNQSINFFKGPYQLAVVVLGDATTPPAGVINAPAPFPFVLGQRLFAKVNAVRTDGRLSPTLRFQLDT